MSKVNNMLEYLISKVGTAGKELVRKHFLDLLSDIEGKSVKAIQAMSVGLNVAQKAFLLRRASRWI